MSRLAQADGSANAKASHRVGWSWDLTLLLLVLASRLGPALLLRIICGIGGLVGGAIAMCVDWGLFLAPGLAMLAVVLRLVHWWAAVGVARRILWTGLVVVFAVALGVKSLPWITAPLDTHMAGAMSVERAYLYGLRQRTRLCLDVQAIRTWARQSPGLDVADMGTMYATGQLPKSAWWLDPVSACVLTDDATAVFTGEMIWGGHVRWVLVVYQDDGRMLESGQDVLPVAPGVWLAWHGELRPVDY